LRAYPFCLCFFLFLIFICSRGHAQEKDFQTWNSIGLKKSITKKLDLTLSQELRLRYNSTRLRTSFTDIGLNYEVINNLDVGISYRFIISPGAVAHRAYSDVSYKYSLNKWSFQARIRYQHQVEINTFAKNYFRPKVTIDYNINKKWEPYISAELFYRAAYYKGDLFDEYRLSAGIAYDFNKRHSIKGFYLLNQEFNVNAADEDHVAGVSYEYDF
jgi:hypothetical protein